MSNWINFGTSREDATNFGRMANMSWSDTLLFDGYDDTSSGYKLSVDSTKFRLPVNERETVCSIADTGLSKRIAFPHAMPVKVEYSNFNYRNTFKNCIIEINEIDNVLLFTNKVKIDVASMFESATFVSHNDELCIDFSALRVNSMFRLSSGLRKLSFASCDLTDLRKLAVGSDVREIEFVKCKFILDNDQLVNYDGASALTVFGSKIEKLMLRNCSKDFVELVMNLFEDEWDLYPRLEIEILDE